MNVPEDGDSGPESIRTMLGGPWFFLLAGVVVSVGTVLLGQVRVAGYLLGVTLAGVAAMRGLKDERTLGAINVRSRRLDVAILLLTTVAIVVVTTTLKLS